MIRPEHRHRFEGDSGVDIATQAIDVVAPDGKRLRVVLRLGAPFRKPDAHADIEWWIRTELENLDSTDGPIAGAGPLHAITLGIGWMIGRLEIFERKFGYRYCWPDTEEPFEYREILSTHRRKT